MAFLGIKNPFGSRPGASTPPYAGAQPSAGGGIPDFQPGTRPQMPMQQPQLPPAPPSVRSSDPFAKENRRQTLLNIGAAFLSEDDFFRGMGKAASGLSGRIDQLKKSPNKVEYGGPNNQFEITTDEMGNRTIREVPEFAKAIQAERESKRPTLSPRDNVELRARAIAAINRMPPEQRQAAYAQFMSNPAAFGGVDTTGLPATYDPQAADVLGAMGQSVPQYEAGADRDRAFEHRKTVDERRLGQGDARLRTSAAKGTGSGRRGALRGGVFKASPGYILD